MKRVLRKKTSKKSVNHYEKVSVVGTVTPIGWDYKDHAIRYSIFTHDQEDLIVENSTLNHKLSLLLNSVVEATGVLYENKDGEKCMRLEKVQGLRGPSSPAPATVNNGWYEEFSINVPNKLAILKRDIIFDQYGEAC